MTAELLPHLQGPSLALHFWPLIGFLLSFPAVSLNFSVFALVCGTVLQINCGGGWRGPPRGRRGPLWDLLGAGEHWSLL